MYFEKFVIINFKRPYRYLPAPLGLYGFSQASPCENPLRPIHIYFRFVAIPASDTFSSRLQIGAVVQLGSTKHGSEERL
jgi:hypothetical protein